MIELAQETVEQVLAEIQPLLHDHWEEIASHKDKIPLAPDYDQYRKMEEAGKLLICTVRDKANLVGYSIYFVHRGIHYSKTLVSTNDVFYVSPAYRRKTIGVVLI